MRSISLSCARKAWFLAILLWGLPGALLAQAPTTGPASTRPAIQGQTLRFPAWPILIEDPEGIFVYATRGATNQGISPYQNNLAIGQHTLNPITHRSPRCNSAAGFDGFCGDEVAFGHFTLEHDVMGRDNTAIGDHALANLVSGSGNTAVGSSAAANIHASSNVDAFGVSACQNAADFPGPITCLGQASLETAGPASQYSVALGFQAGLHTNTAEFSTILGIAAGFEAVTNRYSVLVGESACHNVKSINNTICIGTINGPASGDLSDRLWLGGNGGSLPILFGDLRSNALAINSTSFAPGAALTIAGGDIALPPAYAVQWAGDTGIARIGQGKLAIGNGARGDTSGSLALARIDLSARTSVTAAADGELAVGRRDAGAASGHIVAAYVRTAPVSIADLAAIDPSPATGDRALVIDANNCAFGSAVKTGGATMCPVYFNGTSWIAG